MDVAIAMLVIWIEGENFKTAPEGLERTVGEKAAASGGKTLYGGALDKKGFVVTYEFDVPADCADAQIIFRYARLHWKPTMKPAAVEMALAGPGGEVKKELAFAGTPDWGDSQKDYRLLAAPLGAVKKGKHTLKLTSLAEDNSVTLDGFFVADRAFKITDEELNRCCRIEITSEGYLGLARPTLAVRQDMENTLKIATRRFGGGELPELAAGFYHPRNGDHEAPALRAVKMVADGKSGTYSIDLSPKTNPSIELALPDGDVHWRLGAKGMEVFLSLAMCGKFISTLDVRLKAVTDYTADLEKKQLAPEQGKALVDLQNIVRYLEAGRKRFGGESAGDGDAAGRDSFRKGLAAMEGMGNPGALLANLRRSLDQAEAMIKNLSAGKDAYDSLAGDLRRAYISAADGNLVPYRVFLPDAYAKSEKLPFVLILHGGGGNEDAMPDSEGGAIFRILNGRGYVGVAPKWHSRNRPWGDVLQLLQLTLKEYPKIDADRVYCTGISMGGFGTYKITTEHPELFAAGCCVSGTGEPNKAESLKNVPLMIIQGGMDTVVPPAGAEKVAAKMKELGYTVDYRLFPKYGHNYHADEYLKLTLDFFDKCTRKRS